MNTCGGKELELLGGGTPNPNTEESRKCWACTLVESLCNVRTSQDFSFICGFRFVLSNQGFHKISRTTFDQSNTRYHFSGWFRFDECHTSSQRWSYLISLRNFLCFLQQLTNYTTQHRVYLPPIPTHEVKSRHDWRKLVSVTYWYRGEKRVTEKSSTCYTTHQGLGVSLILHTYIHCFPCKLIVDSVNNFTQQLTKTSEHMLYL